LVHFMVILLRCDRLGRTGPIVLGGNTQPDR
jgi:hypothetical protein